MRRALVTGSSRGIGAAIARRLAAAGIRVAIHHREQVERARECAAAIVERGGPEPVILAADLRDPAACRRLIEDARSALGGLDVLVHNAGIQRPALITNMGERDWDDVIAVNLSAAFHLARAAIPAMIDAGGGDIVNISSASAYVTHAGLASYVAAKQGLIGLTKAMATELARHRIRVNAVAPGLTDTDMIAAVPDRQREQLLRSVPLGRMADPAEIAELVAWVVTGASYSTGNVFHASGGVVMG